MSLNSTPASHRIHIGIFGRRNAGKSSVINAITGQNLAIVSEQKGTTTDPVQKAMELLPLGPVVLIDTPGLDDVGALGSQRIKKAEQILAKTDIALLVIDGTIGMDNVEENILITIKDKKIPYLIVTNKSDLLDTKPHPTDESIYISAHTKENIDVLKEALAKLGEHIKISKPLVADLIQTGDFVVLVTPIDEGAPKGRLILPQQQVIREIIDFGATALVTDVAQLQTTLNGLKQPPSLIITDSQVFQKVNALAPANIRLTSFSILFARFKGSLTQLCEGAFAINRLKDGDYILISEGCTHHRQCQDIGTVKLPHWLKQYTKKHLHFHFTSGNDFPLDITAYAIVVHCGGCVLNEREMKNRLNIAKEQNIAMTNYGMAIAFMNGILEKSTNF
ncbi:MAG: [FeFe] hydrogenase H-cluster maturation GTPase HydF [Lachnospiraceae bacterium]|nr:[FeFe] hydrogenase H-cluster maturation GTPase HydF [Lachnospiraceae bacterium]